MAKKKQQTAGTDERPRHRTIDVAERNGVALVTLDRPDVHNAFDETLIAELTQALEALDRSPTVRAVVLLGAGESFCAGADLGWMRRVADYSHEQNLADARSLARLLQTLHGLTKPTIARVHGPAYGGGVGLVACCDIVVAVPEATFAFSEVKLGLVPATIGPYVVQAIGVRAARRYMLTGERFEAAEAFRIGLVHELAPLPEIDGKINEMLGELMLGGPAAQAAVKGLMRSIAGRAIDRNVVDDTAERIAAIRATDEAREGVGAFLGKRSPAWVPEELRKRR
jgi:methylglutaconyl-CoA hydratase